MKNLVALSFCASLAVACANQPCHQLKRPELAEGTKAVQSTSGQKVGPLKSGDGHVLVFKPDGSLQCSKTPGRSLDDMEKDLAGLTVYSREKRPDGLMRIQVCGSPTGMVNIYEISASVASEAEKRGFRQVETVK